MQRLSILTALRKKNSTKHLGPATSSRLCTRLYSKKLNNFKFKIQRQNPFSFE